MKTAPCGHYSMKWRYRLLPYIAWDRRWRQRTFVWGPIEIRLVHCEDCARPR